MKKKKTQKKRPQPDWLKELALECKVDLRLARLIANNMSIKGSIKAIADLLPNAAVTIQNIKIITLAEMPNAKVTLLDQIHDAEFTVWAFSDHRFVTEINYKKAPDPMSGILKTLSTLDLSKKEPSPDQPLPRLFQAKAIKPYLG